MLYPEHRRVFFALLRLTRKVTASQVTLGTTTLVSKPWRSRIFSVCTERVWKGHNTSSCVQPVASTVVMWQRLWRPMTWCPGSSSHMPHRLSSILAHRSLRCLLAFSWRWKRTALRASMIPWSNARWSPNQFLCFNTPTRIATLIATHASIFTNWMIYIMYWYVKSPNFLARNVWPETTSSRTFISGSPIFSPTKFHENPKAGGIGVAISNVRASGSYIRGTNGHSNGLVPMLRNFNETARYVDQGGGKRKGSFAMCLGRWTSGTEIEGENELDVLVYKCR